MKLVPAIAALLIAPSIAFAQSAGTVPAAADKGKPAASAPSPERERFRQVCGADVDKLCAGVERGKGKMRACLETNKDKVSAGCKDLMAERAAQKKS